MFGLTEREQRLKADQEAAALLVGLPTVAIKDIAEANAKELELLRAENIRLRAALKELTRDL